MYKLFQYENWYGHRKRLFWIADRIKYRGDYQECIEVGCGTGAYITIPLNMLMMREKSENRVYGIDISESSIRKARGGAERLGLPKNIFIHGDIADHSKQYDVVICSECLEHIDSLNLNKFAEDLCRMVKAGGLLFITVPNGSGSFEKGKALKKRKWIKRIYDKIYKLMDRINHTLFREFLYYEKLEGENKVLKTMSLSMTDHIQFFSSDEIKRIFERNNMKLLEFTGSCMYSGIAITLLPPFQCLTRLNNWLGGCFPQKASGYYFVFRK